MLHLFGNLAKEYDTKAKYYGQSAPEIFISIKGVLNKKVSVADSAKKDS